MSAVVTKVSSLVLLGIVSLGLFMIVAPGSQAAVNRLQIEPTSTQGKLGGATLTFTVQADDQVAGVGALRLTVTHPLGEATGDASLDFYAGTPSSSWLVLYKPPPIGSATPNEKATLTVQDIASGIRTEAYIKLTLNYAGAECEIDSNNPAPVGSCQKDTLRCIEAGEVLRCVATIDKIAIGTWCSEVAHCDVDIGTFQFTCDKENNICVGAGRGVACGDIDVNQDPELGQMAGNVVRAMRCDLGLICQFYNGNSDEGRCKRDIGVEIATELGLGHSTEDIRDQIRRLINIVLGFLGVIGVAIVLYGGFLWMSALGDDEKVGKGKKTIIAGAIGLTIIGLAWTIVSYILAITRGL